MSHSPPIRAWRAVAHSNIALVKYWGKRSVAQEDLNLPAVSSLSLTLDELRTETRISPAQADSFLLDQREVQDQSAKKVFAHLDRVWRALGHPGSRPSARVESTNHLPTAAGLASSASGFAALTLAAHGAFAGSLDLAEQSRLARRGSGSAARSLWGGAVRLDKGERDDGSDCRAYPVATQAECSDWSFVIVHTAQGPKSIGSTGAMQRSAKTSPYYPAWVQGNEDDVAAAQEALRAKDLARLGAIMEHSCYKMHACMWATQPPLRYWNHVTLRVLDRLDSLRKEGLEGYATSDAGPHIKILCTTAAASSFVEAMSEVPEVHHVQRVAIGPDANAEAI